MSEICCDKCDFIKRDGEFFCLLDMHVLEDIYKKFECGLLDRYLEFRNGGNNES